MIAQTSFLKTHITLSTLSFDYDIVLSMQTGS